MNLFNNTHNNNNVYDYSNKNIKQFDIYFKSCIQKRITIEGLMSRHSLIS